MPDLRSLVDDYCGAHPRERRSLLPTPMQEIGAVAPGAGIGLWCKRDDLTGFGMGGNKTRKLDFLFGKKRRKGYDTVVAEGGSQSNFCRLAALYGAAYGLEVHLVLGSKAPPAVPTGNLILMALAGAELHHVTLGPGEGMQKLAAAARDLTRALEGAGRKVLYLPLGGSTPVGALGYVDAMAEILEDEERLRTETEDEHFRFDAVFVASGSAGTQAGLLAGKAAAGWRGQIVGVSVLRQAPPRGLPPTGFDVEVHDLARSTLRELGAQKAEVPPADVIVDYGHLGEGYGIPTAEAQAAQSLFARRAGLILDPTYTSKAAAAMLHHLRHRDPTSRVRIPEDGNVLFLHTGGAAGLFR